MMKRYRTVALLAAVVITGTALFLVASASDPAPDRSAVTGKTETMRLPKIEVDRTEGTLRISPAEPRRSAASVGASETEEPPEAKSSGLPGTEGRYELAEPGDRSPAPPPDFFRSLNGSLDNSRGAPLFASFCKYSHSRTDDPIVYPREPGASHLHDFLGNTTTNANSTDDSLRDAGSTTCENFPGDSAAYWVPALYENGHKVQPSSMNAYYTPGPKDYRTIEPFPRGLKMLVKDADASTWYCGHPTNTARFYEEVPLCAAGEHLGLKIVFPDCWDGKYLDVPDHMKHLDFADGSKCPASHPVPVPQLILFIDYMEARGGNVDLAPLDNPSAPHADFVNSWDQTMLIKFVRDCINAGVHCGGSPPA